MAGKSKKEKKKQAKTKKRISEELRRKTKAVVATQAGDEANNNLEPTPAEVNMEREIPMQTLEDNVRELEARKAAQKSPEDEKPFDPSSIVANILKKREDG